MNTTGSLIASLVLAGTVLAAARGAEPLAATVIAVEGHVVTIADAAGRKKKLEVVDTKGLVRGGTVSWCEEDCRVLVTADHSIQVRRVLEAKP